MAAHKRTFNRGERIDLTTKRVTHFFLFPQGDFDAVYRHHDVDLFLLDVFHLELILQREDRQTETYSYLEGSR